LFSDNLEPFGAACFCPPCHAPNFLILSSIQVFSFLLPIKRSQIPMPGIQGSPRPARGSIQLHLISYFTMYSITWVYGLIPLICFFQQKYLLDIISSCSEHLFSACYLSFFQWIFIPQLLCSGPYFRAYW
jgi:hypothetical protein